MTATIIFEFLTYILESPRLEMLDIAYVYCGLGGVGMLLYVQCTLASQRPPACIEDRALRVTPTPKEGPNNLSVGTLTT